MVKQFNRIFAKTKQQLKNMQKTNIVKDSLLESMAAIFNHSYSGQMVGKNEGEYLNWSELSDPEKDLISKKNYDSIVSVYATNTNRKKPANTMVTEINDYAREVAMVAIILSDNYMKQLYEKSNMGYMNCIDTLHQWAVEYITKFAHVTEWDEFLDTDRTFGHCSCWDDHCIAFGKAKLDTI